MSIKITVICKYCEEVIKRPKINQKYHKHCYILHRKDYKRKKEFEYYKIKVSEKLNKICIVCKKEFVATHGNQIYCDSCRTNLRSIIKGFSSLEEERDFKSKKCVECGAPLVYDYYQDTNFCLMCGYSKRYPTPVNEDSYTKINLEKSIHNYPTDIIFQKVRGTNQIQYARRDEGSTKSISYNVEFANMAFCDSCGMLKDRCVCGSTVQKIG